MTGALAAWTRLKPCYARVHSRQHSFRASCLSPGCLRVRSYAVIQCLAQPPTPTPPKKKDVLAACSNRVAGAAAFALATCILTSPALAEAVAPSSSPSSGPDVASLLDWMLGVLLLYWLVKSFTYTFYGSFQQLKRNISKYFSGGAPKDTSGAAPLTGNGSSQAHMRALVDLTQKSRNHPDVRNKALSISATSSVALAVKDSQARIKEVLREFFSQKSNLVRPKDADPIAELVFEHCDRLSRDGLSCDSLTEAELQQLEQQLAEVVAEKAALEQIETLINVVHQASEGSAALAAAVESQKPKKEDNHL